jgi:hypothetical protein
LSLQFPAGSVPPAATGVHVPAGPLAEAAQDMQVPVQVVAQQTPWAQMPLPHSGPVAQAAPFDLSPHEPLLQVAKGAQSALVAQVALQALVPQANGKQEVDAGVTQVPVPSQVEPAVKVVPLAGQAAAAQAVPCWNFSHPPAWHLPSVPQPVAPWSTQVPAGSGPEATAVQRPIDPAMAHDWQVPVQAVVQQTPCSQFPDPHSGSAEQKAPIGLRPHELLVQTLPDEQSVLPVQAWKHRVVPSHT